MVVLRPARTGRPAQPTARTRQQPAPHKGPTGLEGQPHGGQPHGAESWEQKSSLSLAGGRVGRGGRDSLGDQPDGGGPSAPVLALPDRPDACERWGFRAAGGAGPLALARFPARWLAMLRPPTRPPRTCCRWSCSVGCRSSSPDRLAPQWATRSAPGARSPSCPKVRARSSETLGAEARLPEAAVRPRGAYRVPAAAGSELGGVAAV